MYEIDIICIKVIIFLFQEILLDSMNGVTGPYCERLVSELGLEKSSSQNNKPLPDFGGLHPDPNLKWAQHLIMSLRNRKSDSHL